MLRIISPLALIAALLIGWSGAANAGHRGDGAHRGGQDGVIYHNQGGRRGDYSGGHRRDDGRGHGQYSDHGRRDGQVGHQRGGRDMAHWNGPRRPHHARGHHGPRHHLPPYVKRHRGHHGDQGWRHHRPYSWFWMFQRRGHHY